MDIKLFPLGPLETNSYLVSAGSAAVAIDVGGDPAEILAHLRARDLTLEAILLTHLHCDHLYGVDALAKATGAKVLAGAEDAILKNTDVGRGGMMGLPVVAPFPWDPVEPGEMQLLGQTCRVLATPGHSPGSRSYHFPQEQVVFVGDLLFQRFIGRSDFPGGDFETLINSVVQQIFPMGPDTVVYPGHGLSTTVGDEMQHNPYFSEFAQ